MIPATVFICSICGEVSARICIYCTKDACENHLCGRCNRCSDCCGCEVPLTVASRGVEEAVVAPAAPVETPMLAVESEMVMEPAEVDDAHVEPPAETTPADTGAAKAGDAQAP